MHFLLQGFDNSSFPSKISRGFDAILDAKVIPKNAAQIWLRRSSDEPDWFTLTNQKSGCLLAAKSSYQVTFEGRYMYILETLI